MKIALFAATTALAAALAAPAASAPGFWWWTNDQANLAVKKMNPRTIDGKRLPLVYIYCTGKGQVQGAVNAYQDGARFRVFACGLMFQTPDGHRTYDQVRRLWIRTSTVRRGAVACWEWSAKGDELMFRCPRSGNVTPPSAPVSP